MKNRIYITLTLALLALAVIVPSTRAQSIYNLPYAFTNFAGTPGVSGSRDGNGNSIGGAQFSLPGGVALDSAGNVYVGDTGNHTIRKITPAGVVTTLAGSPGVIGSADGTGSAAQFYQPGGVAVDSAGNVYVADCANQTIRKITPAGVVTTLAGSPLVQGSADGNGSAARFFQPHGVAVDTAGILYVADQNNHSIRKIDTAGNVTTLAGNGSSGSADGNGSAAQFSYPNNLALDSAGNVYVADFYNDTIRKIDTAGNVTTLAGSAVAAGSADGNGSAARFNLPSAVALDSAGNVYVADYANSTIRKIDTAGNVTTLAGSPGAAGSADGIGSAARFNQPSGVVLDSVGNVYVVDRMNNRVTKGTIVRAAIEVTRSGTDLILAWPGGGTLQSSTNVVGPYVDIPGSSSPFNVVPVGAQNYYRVRQ